MSNLKQEAPTGAINESKYSAPDLRLKRYLDLETKIRELTKEFEQIKEELKHRGTHSTHNFVVTVSEVERSQVPSIKVLVEKFGEQVKSLCTVVSYKTVKVMQKE